MSCVNLSMLPPILPSLSLSFWVCRMFFFENIPSLLFPQCRWTVLNLFKVGQNPNRMLFVQNGQSFCIYRMSCIRDAVVLHPVSCLHVLPSVPLKRPQSARLCPDLQDTSAKHVLSAVPLTYPAISEPREGISAQV